MRKSDIEQALGEGYILKSVASSTITDGATCVVMCKKHGDYVTTAGRILRADKYHGCKACRLEYMRVHNGNNRKRKKNIRINDERVMGRTIKGFEIRNDKDV